MIKQFRIKRIQDVEDFFTYVFKDLECSIHPDDDFGDIINIQTEEPFFSKDEVKVLNSYMDRCFRVCLFNNEDIYDLAMRVDKKIYG